MTNPAVTPEQLLLDLAQEITALKAQIALSTQAPAPSAKEPRASLPDKFDGNRSKFRGFLNQISLVFTLNPARYANDAAKVATVGTLLLAWFNPLIEYQTIHADLLNSWPKFKNALTATFGELDQAVLSASKIRKLVQGC